MVVSSSDNFMDLSKLMDMPDKIMEVANPIANNTTVSAPEDITQICSKVAELLQDVWHIHDRLIVVPTLF